MNQALTRAGRIRFCLASKLQEIGFLCEASEIKQGNHRQSGDGVGWEVYGVLLYGVDSGRGVRIYSFDTMADCAKSKLVSGELSDSLDVEVSSRR